MKLSLLKLTLLSLLICLVSSCDIMQDALQNKELPSREFPITQAYFSINVQSGISVELVRSDNPNLIVRAKEDLLSSFGYRIENGELFIYSQKTVSNPGNLQVAVPFGQIFRIKAAEGSIISSRHLIEEASIVLFADTQSKLDFNLHANTTEAYVSTNSEVILQGKTNMFLAKAYTQGVVNAENMKARVCIAEAETNAKIYANVYEMLHAETNTNGEVIYTGDPEDVRFNSGSQSDSEVEEGEGNNRRDYKTQPQRRNQENEEGGRERPDRNRD